jgi:hypothetical protein
MKTIITAANLFFGIYITIMFTLWVQQKHIPSEFYIDLFIFIFFPLLAIINFYHVLNFIKNK